eukprot:COSAG04_NODE_13459_length_605_cov_1.235178_2_plen_34_part_01
MAEGLCGYMTVVDLEAIPSRYASYPEHPHTHTTQ